MNIRKSLLFSFSSSYAQIGLRFVASLFIARLLTPHEFGVFSLAMVLVFVADALRNFGVAGYVIQERDLTSARLNSAAGLNFLMSWSMALIVIALAGPVSRFFDAPEIANLLWLLAVNFVLLPFGSTAMGCLKRNLLFDRVAKIEVAGTAVQSVSSVLLAWWGFSYYSMALASVLATPVTIGLVWLMRPEGLRIIPGFSDLSRVIRFGSLSTLNQLFTEAGRRMPDFVLARVLNLEALAFFTRAAGLIEIFNRVIVTAVARVAMPHFAAQARTGAGVEQQFLLSITFLTGLTWPFLLVLGTTSPQLIPLLYGNQWGPSIPLVQILCAGELLLAPFYLESQVLIATGRMGVSTLLTLTSVLLRLPPLVALAPQGLTVVTLGYAAVNILIALIYFLVATRILRLRACAFWRSLIPSFGVTCSVGVALLFAHMVGPPTLVGLAVHLFAAMLAWVLGIWLFNHPFAAELNRLFAGLRRT